MVLGVRGQGAGPIPLEWWNEMLNSFFSEMNK